MSDQQNNPQDDQSPTSHPQDKPREGSIAAKLQEFDRIKAELESYRDRDRKFDSLIERMSALEEEIKFIRGGKAPPLTIHEQLDDDDDYDEDDEEESEDWF